jgi:2-dehydropantoate 2-reductase
MPEFDFAILGAGAIGSILGGHLTRAGHTVAMLARGARADYLERSGITLTGLSEFTVPVRTLRNPASLRSAATLIVATKTPGTAAALEPLRGAQLGIALSIQNGPLKNELLSAAFGRERVLGALADTSGELLPGGEVLFTRNVNILLGELGGGDSARAQVLARTLDASGVRAAATAEITTLEWSKFCAWVGLMALAVATRAATWEYLSDPDAALLIVRMVREMGLLARGLGIALSDRAVLPVENICAASEADAVAIVRRIGGEYRASAPGHRMSALQDVLAGRPLEVNETLGYACARAGGLGLELPLVDAFRRLIAAIDRTRRETAAAAAR